MRLATIHGVYFHIGEREIVGGMWVLRDGKKGRCVFVTKAKLLQAHTN